jgi:hypothetical protein
MTDYQARSFPVAAGDWEAAYREARAWADRQPRPPGYYWALCPPSRDGSRNDVLAILYPLPRPGQ